MSLTAKEIIEVMQAAKEMGLRHVKVEGFEADLGPITTVFDGPELEADKILNPPHILDEFTDEELLYWSSPYFDELQAKKIEQQKGKVNGQEN